MLIQIPSFNGIVPKADPTSLPNTAAQDAIDCNFIAGKLTALERDNFEKDVDALPEGQAVNGGFVWTKTNSAGVPLGVLFSWPYEVDVIRSPVQNDKWNRIYWTGVNNGVSEYKLLSLTYAEISGTEVAASYDVPGLPSEDNVAKVGVIDYNNWDYTINDLGISIDKVKSGGKILSSNDYKVDTEFYLLEKGASDFSKATPLLRRGIDQIPGDKMQYSVTLDITNLESSGIMTATIPTASSIATLSKVETPGYDSVIPYDITITGMVSLVGNVWVSWVSPQAPISGVAWVRENSSDITFMTLAGQSKYGNIAGDVYFGKNSGVTVQFTLNGATGAKFMRFYSPSVLTYDILGGASNPPAGIIAPVVSTNGEGQLGIKIKVFKKNSNGTVNQSTSYEGSYFENASFNKPVVIGTSRVDCAITSTDRRTFTLTIGSGTSQPLETRAYVMTAVNMFGDESAPSDPVELTLDPGLERAVFKFDESKWKIDSTDQKFGAPTVSQSIFYERSVGHGFRFYRTATSSTGDTEFLYAFTAKIVGAPDLPGDVYLPLVAGTPYYTVTDGIETAALGAACPTTNSARNTNELQSLQGLIRIHNGMTAAFLGNEIWISEPFRPATYRSDGIHTLPVQVVSLVALEQGFIALTRGEPYYFSGQTPETFSSQAIPSSYPCIGKYSVTKIGNAIMYLSPEGPVVINGMQAVLDTKTWSRESWMLDYGQKVVSEEMRLANYGHRLIGYFPGKADGYLFDMDDGNWTRITTRIDFTMYLPPRIFKPTHHFSALLFSDGRTTGDGANRPGARYLKFSHYTNGPTEYKRFIWHSKDFVLQAPVNFGAIQLFGTGYATVEIYVDGELAHLTEPFELFPEGTILRLPSGFKGTRWSFKILSPDNGGTATVTRFNAATTVRELRNV